MMNPVLVLFAKKPQVGKVKTRLCPPLSLIQAKQVAQILIKNSIETAVQNWPGEIELSVWPDTQCAQIKALAKQYPLTLSLQADGNLGDKMYQAMAEKINQDKTCMIMGCDIPGCPASVYQLAYNKLQQGDSVIGPTVDGGYYCIGINRCHPAMFDHVCWGTSNAYQQTLVSCQDTGITFDHVLPELTDIDDYNDLLAQVNVLPALREFVVGEHPG